MEQQKHDILLYFSLCFINVAKNKIWIFFIYFFYDVLGEADVCTGVHASTTLFVFVLLYKFSIQGRLAKRDNALGPEWTDDKCVYFMTTKA